MKINVNGKSVYIYTAGKDLDHSQPTILFVHGAGMESNVFALQSRHFAFNGYNVLAVNRSGHGAEGSDSHSEGPHKDTVEEEATWLADVLDQLGIDKVNLIGHSLGNLITLHFAGTYPERVDKLMIVAGAPAIPVHPYLLDQSADDADIADQLIASWGYGTKGHYGGNRTTGSWMLGASIQLLYRQGSQVLHKDLAMCQSYKAGEDAAAKVTAPTLIIAATDDKMTPHKAGKKLSTLITGAKFVTFEGCGHMIMPEQPDRTLLELKAFLKG